MPMPRDLHRRPANYPSPSHSKPRPILFYPKPASYYHCPATSTPTPQIIPETHNAYPYPETSTLSPQLVPQPRNPGLLGLHAQIFYLGDPLRVRSAGLEHLDLLVDVGRVKPAGALARLAVALPPQPADGHKGQLLGWLVGGQYGLVGQVWYGMVSEWSLQALRNATYGLNKIAIKYGTIWRRQQQYSSLFCGHCNKTFHSRPFRQRKASLERSRMKGFVKSKSKIYI